MHLAGQSPEDETGRQGEVPDNFNPPQWNRSLRGPHGRGNLQFRFVFHTGEHRFR